MPINLGRRNEDNIIALGPLRWNLAKIQHQWDGRVADLVLENGVKKRAMEETHREQRRVLSQQLRASREALKATLPANSRLVKMRASRDNLSNLGRIEEADKVNRKLETLEKFCWAKAPQAAGFNAHAKLEMERLLGAQQAELGSLNQSLRREICHARQAQDAEVKAQRRKNHSSSDDVWSIWSAAKFGDTQRLAYLLTSPGADVDARDPDSGWTSLHFASRQGRLKVVEVLIENKAFVGASGPDGRTPLHLAAGFGTCDVCGALLHAGADKNVTDRYGQTPRALAESRDRKKTVELLRAWRPIGLTATQTKSIEEYEGGGHVRPWETEADPSIRAQLRALDMKRATFGGMHAGQLTTLGKLASLCRATGRLEDAKRYLEQLASLLQGSMSTRSLPRTSSGSSRLPMPTDDADTLAVTLGNLGVVYHEQGAADKAAETLEASLRVASYSATTSAGGGTERNRYLVEASTRNLGLHFLSEGRVDDARRLLRSYVEILEDALRSDMAGGHESVELIAPLTLLSYAEMLSGHHGAAEQAALRAHKIADDYQKYRDAPPVVSGGGGDSRDAFFIEGDSSDILVPRLEWIGVQKFVAEEHESAREFFMKARALVLRRVNEYSERPEGSRDVAGNDKGSSGLGDGFSSKACGRRYRDRPNCGSEIARSPHSGSASQTRMFARTAAGVSCADGVREVFEPVHDEFSPDAMRLDLCAAVAICRQGPEAF